MVSGVFEDIIVQAGSQGFDRETLPLCSFGKATVETNKRALLRVVVCPNQRRRQLQCVRGPERMLDEQSFGDHTQRFGGLNFDPLPAQR